MVQSLILSLDQAEQKVFCQLTPIFINMIKVNSESTWVKSVPQIILSDKCYNFTKWVSLSGGENSNHAVLSRNNVPSIQTLNTQVGIRSELAARTTKYTFLLECHLAPLGKNTLDWLGYPPLLRFFRTLLGVAKG